MREIEILQSILNKALLQADSHPVSEAHLILGELFELDQHAVQQHWRELGKGTPAEKAQLHFRFIKAEAQCMSCFQKYHPINRTIHCPHCGSFGAKILAGEEFQLEAIKLGHD